MCNITILYDYKLFIITTNYRRCYFSFQGRTFAAIIHSFIESYKCLQEEYLPAYNTPEGRKAYEDTLNCVKSSFPQYIDELQGTADGAKVSFHEVRSYKLKFGLNFNTDIFQLFLLHMDNIILNEGLKEELRQPYGCSSICVNREGQVIFL